MSEARIVHALLELVILVFSLSLHEVGHAYAAYRLGDPTAKMMGRLTLDPRAHADLVGTILIPLTRFLFPGFIMFGWAKPVPITAENFRNPRRDNAIVALAGPAANVVLALASLAALWFLDSTNFLGTGYASRVSLLSFFTFFFWVNFGLAIFNLIPIAPLDGSWILRALLPGGMSYSFSKMDRYGIIILFAAMYLGWLDLVFNPVMRGFFSFLYLAGLGHVADMLYLS